MIRDVKILGVKVSRVNLKETMSLFEEWIQQKLKKRICVLPVNCILWAYKNPELAAIYNSAALCLADGVPLLWASRWLGFPIPGRVTGLDLLPAFAELASKREYSFFFMGAKEGVADLLADTLRAKYPNLKIAGTYSPPFSNSFSEKENNKIIRLINTAKPDILWVSLTAPKQDIWIYQNYEKLDVSIALGVGGAFDVTAGIVRRAPLWMQHAGLEWFYRFLKEPFRLFRRYFIEAPLFIPLIIAQVIKEKLFSQSTMQ